MGHGLGPLRNRRVFLASLFTAALFTSPAFCEGPAAKPLDLPDFVIRTSVPERALYAIVQYFNEHAFAIGAQRVVGANKYEITINSESGKAVLLLQIVEGGLRSEGSYCFGDRTFYSTVLAPLILSLQEPELP